MTPEQIRDLEIRLAKLEGYRARKVNAGALSGFYILEVGGVRVGSAELSEKWVWETHGPHYSTDPAALHRLRQKVRDEGKWESFMQTWTEKQIQAQEDMDYYIEVGGLDWSAIDLFLNDPIGQMQAIEEVCL